MLGEPPFGSMRVSIEETILPASHRWKELPLGIPLLFPARRIVYTGCIHGKREVHLGDSEKLTASLEDYLEAIWHLIQEKQVARSKDIAERLGVNKSSVTGALKNLGARDLIHYEAYQYVTLTEGGRKAATDIVRRHEVIHDFLTRILGIPEDVSESNACRIEHALDGQTLEKLVNFVEFVLTCPRTKEGWTEGFREFCHKQPNLARCHECLDTFMAEIDESMAGAMPARGPRLSLSDLAVGEEARIVEISPGDAIPAQLRKKGLTEGALIQLEKADGEDEKLAAKVRGYHVNLQRDQASAVKIKKVR